MLKNTCSRSFIALLIAFVLALSSITVAAQNGQRDFSKERARSSPEWVRAGVIYEINTRTFSPEGNFNGVTAQLDRLKNLGVTILWLMPIHPVGQKNKKGSIGSPYAVRDYYAINPDYGTKEDLKRLIAETHRRGLKIIIDIVANHTAWDSVMMGTPAYYTHDASGKIVPPVPDWADVADLNYENSDLRRYMTDMLKYWLKEFDLDGFRSDVAGFVPTDFWEQAREELERIEPNIVMLAEWNAPDLLVKAFDLDYAWPFHSALTRVMENGAPASTLRATWEEERARFPQGALHMRFSDNHDEERAIARFGEGGALAASFLVFTMDGVPMLYNGMEVGDTTESGAPALFERLPVFWQIAERRTEFPRFYDQIIALRRKHTALQQGETEWLRNSDDSRIVTYIRRAGNEEFLVAVNLSSRPFVGLVEAANGAGFKDVTPLLDESQKRPPVSLPALALDAWGFRLYTRPVK